MGLTCSICSSTTDVTLLPTGNLCAICDSLGRLYAARNAFHEAQYRRGVERGYQGNVTMHNGPPSWSNESSASSGGLAVQRRVSGDQEPLTFRHLLEGGVDFDTDASHEDKP